MKIRSEIHLSGQAPARLILVPRPEEKLDHLALKLAAFIMFLPAEPIVEPSKDHPALGGFTHRPDVCTLDISGQISIWVECGQVTTHKLNKVSRRLSTGRIIVIKQSEAEGKRLRSDLAGVLKNHNRIQIWTFNQAQFKDWCQALNEKTEIFGEAGEKNFNLVVNETPFAFELSEV